MAQLKIIEGAGHFTWLDAPDRYWPRIIEFVTDITGAVAGV
jgi:pimeloyl-ACP methyl ester carboxylesterase